MTHPTPSPAHRPYAHRTVAEMDDAQLSFLLTKMRRAGNKRYWRRELEAFLKEIGR